MTTPSGSDSGPLHLIGEEWVDHGYPISPIFEYVEPCIICGVANNACTGHEFGLVLGGNPMAVPYDVPPTGSESSNRSYMPGDSVRADRYDQPLGSQGRVPAEEPELPTVDSDVSIYTDPNNPNYAYVEGAASLPPGLFVGIPVNEFELVDDSYIVVPQDE